MKRVWKEERLPILQALGKTEEELTWEEDLQVFFDSTGPDKVRRQFVIAKLVDDKYLEQKIGMKWFQLALRGINKKP